jgi:hypothetical protein
MSVFDSLLHGLEERDRDRAETLIADSVAADRAEALAGGQPHQSVDMGSRPRRSRTAVDPR